MKKQLFTLMMLATALGVSNIAVAQGNRATFNIDNNELHIPAVDVSTSAAGVIGS